MSKFFIICGVPRSGTTIIARFIGGLPGVCVHHEPLQTFGKEYLVGDVRRIIKLLALPNTARFVGIKEPLHHVPGYGRYANGELLAALKLFGATFIWIERDPIATFNSQKTCWKDPVFQDVKLFVQNWNAYQTLRADEPAIEYEAFCNDPIAEWRLIKPLPIDCSTELHLAPCDTPEFMGCHQAKVADKIERDDSPNIVTDEEAKYIRGYAIA